MKLTRINYNGGYLWVEEKAIIKFGDTITDKYRVWVWKDTESLLGRRKVVAQSSNLSIPNVPYVEFEEDDWYDKAVNELKRLGFLGAIAVLSKFKPSKGRYSEDDLRKALELKETFICEANGKDKLCYCRKDSDCTHRKYITTDEIIASLNQPPYEIEIETTRVRFPKGDDGWEDVYAPVTYECDGKTYLKVKL